MVQFDYNSGDSMFSVIPDLHVGLFENTKKGKKSRFLRIVILYFFCNVARGYFMTRCACVCLCVCVPVCVHRCECMCVCACVCDR